MNCRRIELLGNSEWLPAKPHGTWKGWGMYCLHCTKKLLDRIKPSIAASLPPPTTALGNWYATALFWKPQLALLVNERTLLPVLMPLRPLRR
jgi:hypothetical protein